MKRQPVLLVLLYLMTIGCSQQSQKDFAKLTFKNRTALEWKQLSYDSIVNELGEPDTLFFAVSKGYIPWYDFESKLELSVSVDYTPCDNQDIPCGLTVTDAHIYERDSIYMDNHNN